MIAALRTAAALAVATGCLAAASPAIAVSDLQVTGHVVPAEIRTGDVLEARVTVTNVGDTATEAETVIEWHATDDEGSDFEGLVMRPAVCPPGSEALGFCRLIAPIASGASVTAVFSGMARAPGALQARVSVFDAGRVAYAQDMQRFTITGPALPESLAPRVTDLSVVKRRLHAGERARLRFRLDRRAKTLHAALFRCLGRTGCRRVDFIANSAITRSGRRGRNGLAYRLPGTLEPGRYSIRVWAYEAFHRQTVRAVRIRVLPP